MEKRGGAIISTTPPTDLQQANVTGPAAPRTASLRVRSLTLASISMPS
jgi:hypothetical protein